MQVLAFVTAAAIGCLTSWVNAAVACSRSAAHAGRDEGHVAAGETILDVVGAFFGGGRPNVGPRARAEAGREFAADLNPALRLGMGERLRVGIGNDEFDALELRGDHVVDRIAASTADAEDQNARLDLGEIRCLEIDGHL